MVKTPNNHPTVIHTITPNKTITLGDISTLKGG